MYILAHTTMENELEHLTEIIAAKDELITSLREELELADEYPGKQVYFSSHEPTYNLSFGQAVQLLKKHPNAQIRHNSMPDCFRVVLIPSIDYFAPEEDATDHPERRMPEYIKMHVDEYESLTSLSCCALIDYARGVIQLGWSPSQSEILGQGWLAVNTKEENNV